MFHILDEETKDHMVLKLAIYKNQADYGCIPTSVLFSLPYLLK